MSDFLDSLNQRKRNIERNRGESAAARRDYCIEHLPQLAHDAVELIKAAFADQYENPENQYRESAEDRDSYEVIQYNGDSHAAWKVGTVPLSIIGMPARLEIEDYSIYLLDNADIISVTSFYDGRTAYVERYQPSRYETEEYNVSSIFYNIATLPGDPNFQKERTKNIPS